MNAFSFFGFLTGLACLVLGILTLIKGESKIHRLWSLFSLAVATWGFGSFFIGQTTNQTLAVFFWHIAYVGVIFIPALIAHFVFIFLELKRKIAIISIYAITGLFIYLNLFTNLFIKDTVFLFEQFYYLANPSLFYNLFVIWFFCIIVYVHWLLLRHLSRSADLKRSQIKYILFALFVGFGGGAFAFLPVYQIYIYPALNSAIFISPLVVAYAILRYRLMDLRGLARKIYFYFLAALSAYLIFYAIAYFEIKVFGSIYSLNAFIVGALLSIVFSLLYAFLLKKIDLLIEKHTFSQYHNYQETILNLTKDLNNYLELNKITSLVSEVVKKTMKVEKVRLLIKEEIEGSLPWEFLVNYARPILQYELANLKNDDKLDQLAIAGISKYLSVNEVFLLVPVVSNRKLVAIIELGRKLDEEYTQDDLKLLENLSFQLGTAIDRAKIYAQLENFNSLLKEKVDEQTKDIQAKNANLQELLEMKSEFLRIVHHQLNTPLSVMKNSLAMLDDGGFSKDETLKYITESVKRLDQTIDDFWTAYELEGEELEVKKEKIDIEVLFKLVFQEKKQHHLVSERKLKLTIKKANFDVPPVIGDSKMLAKIFANLLDNAIFYTAKGSITIAYELADNFLKVKITDTGSGISQADESKLFKRFSRGTEGLTGHPDGSGLGLYVVKKALEVMNGKVTYTTVVGQGSEFVVWLPIYQKV